MATEQDLDERQLQIFENLRDRAFALLEQFGESGYQRHDVAADYSVEGDFTGYPEVVVYVDNLKMLRPPVINALQALIKEYPGWQITVTVTVRGHYDDWPNMGLYVRPHEIIDGLQRQYFPAEFQHIEYDGARKGTACD
jgi:hypothetical protein